MPRYARLRPELAPNGLVQQWDGDSHCFLLCTYWFVECLARAGRIHDAVELFEWTTFSCTKDLGLLAEQAYARTGEPWGNFFQVSPTSISSTPPGVSRRPGWRRDRKKRRGRATSSASCCYQKHVRRRQHACGGRYARTAGFRLLELAPQTRSRTARRTAAAEVGGENASAAGRHPADRRGRGFPTPRPRTPRRTRPAL